MNGTATNGKINMAVAALLAATAVAGCGSSGGSQLEQMERPGTPQAQIKQQSAATTASTPTPTPKPDFVAESEGQSGDKVKLEGRFGPPQTASETDADHSVLESCEGADGREMAVRLDLATTVESSLSGHVVLIFRVPTQNRTLLPPMFLMGYTEGPTCLGSEVTPHVDLGTLEPNQPHSFTLWLVLRDVVTPHEPHPSAQALARQEWLIAQPEIWMDNGRLTVNSISGSHVDECKPLPKDAPGYTTETTEIALMAGTPHIIPAEENGLCS